MPCRFARVSPREQRLGEVQARVAAAAFGSGLEQLVEIVELGGRGGARQRLVQIGVAQVDRSQHELRLRPALGVEPRQRILERARRLLVAALLEQLHRRTHRIVGRARGRAEREPRDDRDGERERAAHGFASLSFAT